MFKYRNTVFYDHILKTRILDHIFPENTVLKIFISHPPVNSSPPVPLPHRFKPVLRVGFYFQSFFKQKNIKNFYRNQLYCYYQHTGRDDFSQYCFDHSMCVQHIVHITFFRFF